MRSDRGGRAGAIVSGNITGVIGWVPGRRAKPASVISERKSALFAASLSRASLDEVTSSSAFSEPATTAGATELENR